MHAHMMLMFISTALGRFRSSFIVSGEEVVTYASM